MPLTFEDIIAAKPKTQSVDVPDWGGSVLIRSLTVEGLATFMEAKDTAKPTELYSLLTTLSVCNEDGSLVFANATPEQIQALSFDAIQTIADEVMKFNRIGEKAKGQDPNP